MQIWSEGKYGVSYFINKTKTSDGKNRPQKDRYQLVRAYMPKGPKTKKYISKTNADLIMRENNKDWAMTTCNEILSNA